MSRHPRAGRLNSRLKSPPRTGCETTASIAAHDRFATSFRPLLFYYLLKIAFRRRRKATTLLHYSLLLITFPPSRTSSGKVFGCGGGTCNHRIAWEYERGRLFGAARSHPTRRGGSEVVRRLDFVSKKEQHPYGCCSFLVAEVGPRPHGLAFSLRRKCCGRVGGAWRRSIN